MYMFFFSQRDGAISIIKDKEFHITICLAK